jgi:hypothetical protein
MALETDPGSALVHKAAINQSAGSRHCLQGEALVLSGVLLQLCPPALMES